MQAKINHSNVSSLRGWRLKSVGVQGWLTSGLMLSWFALAIYSYRHVLGDLFQQWQSNASYSHGPAVIPIAVWLLWHRRATFPQKRNSQTLEPWLAAIGLLFAAHCLLWLGEYYHLPGVQRWTIPLWLSGAVGMLLGRRVLLWSLPAVCFLGFMIPIPFQLETWANQFLQWASAWCSCYLLSLTSTFAVTDGYTLRMASGELGITRDCSGLRMTVAIAAIAYIITFLKERSGGDGLENSKYRRRLAVQLSSMMLLVLPATIFANAVRITLIAWVIDRSQVSSYSSLAHDVGDWCVLPFSAFLFFAFRAWIRSGRDLLDRASGMRDVIAVALDRDMPWRKRILPYLPVVVPPLALATIACASILHYELRRDRVIHQTATAALAYESKADWTKAEACYHELQYLQPLSAETLYRHAWVKLQAAETRNERMQAFYLLEAVLNQSPFHVAALQTYLELALEFNFATAASDSAERLYSVDRNDPKSIQLCVEAMLRFPRESPDWPAFVMEPFSSLVDRFGPPAQWRKGLVIEVASHCVNHAEFIDQRLTDIVDPIVANAAAQVDSAEAYLVAWKYERVFGKGDACIERARLSIDGDCPTKVAYQIYLISAQEAQRASNADVSVEFLKHAIGLLPNERAAYELLGDVFDAKAERLQSTTAYLRAWRLAGDRPAELGVKLAESLARAERYAESERLVTQLMKNDNDQARLPSRGLRLRLMLLQTQLDIQAERYAEALATIHRCRSLAKMSGNLSDTSTDWKRTLESLEAQCLVRSHRYGEAARLFERRAVRADGSADQWTAAARAWQTAGDVFAAECCYRNAVAKQGCDSEVWLEYLRLLTSHDRASAAIDEVTLRQIRRETAPLSDKTLAQAWEIVGNPKLAIEHYRLQASQNGEDVAALAIALARHGKVQEAVELISDPLWAASTSLRAHTAAVIGTSATQLSKSASTTLNRIIQQAGPATSNDTRMLMASVAWYARMQDTNAAIELLERALVLQPENIVAGNNLAMLLADDGKDFSRSLQLIDKVLEKTGPVSDFLDTKGWILVQMNRADDALPWLKAAIERREHAPALAQLHLAAAYLAVGDRRLARKFLDLAQANQLHAEQLNNSEQRAWDMLQKEFMQHEELTKSPRQKQDSEV